MNDYERAVERVRNGFKTKTGEVIKQHGKNQYHCADLSWQRIHR